MRLSIVDIWGIVLGFIVINVLMVGSVLLVVCLNVFVFFCYSV